MGAEAWSFGKGRGHTIGGGAVSGWEGQRERAGHSLWGGGATQKGGRGLVLPKMELSGRGGVSFVGVVTRGGVAISEGGVAPS